jgi:hypothetical protein
MSLSRLEKDAVSAEEARVTKLREKARADTADERKLRKRVMEDEREHTRFCIKGALPGPAVAALPVQQHERRFPFFMSSANAGPASRDAAAR